MDEETTSTGTADAVDTSATGSEAAGGSDESGGVTQEEISAALGPRYKTVAPVVDEKVTEEIEDDTTKPKDDEVVDTESTDNKSTDTGRPTETKPVDTKTEEVVTDESDFSFTVEDANGVSYKINPGDSIEDVLKDFDPKNNGQIIAILDQLRTAKDNQATHYREQSEQQAEADKTERVATIQQGWENEFKQLNIKDDDRKAEIYKYMGEENDKRQAAGRPLIASVEDAKLGLEAKEVVKAKEQAVKDAKETARKNGSLVGGSSAAASGGSPVYQAGSARNANQALKSMGIL